MPSDNDSSRWWLKLVVIGVLATVLFVVARSLPIEYFWPALLGWVETLGASGLTVFGVVYVVSAMLLVPGTVLTLAAGAMYGVLWGTVVVSIAATAAAGLAFLVARYLARDKAQRFMGQRPRLMAIDRAIARDSWKIIALLRLSPVVPFSLSNYFFGLTAIRFWPYLWISFVTMLPATVAYVYLGYAGGEGLSAFTGVGRQRGATQWVMLIIGLVATVVLTAYLTHMAHKAVTASIRDDKSADTADGRPHGGVSDNAQSLHGMWGGAKVMTLALLVLGVASCAYFNLNTIQRWFGPPIVVMQEAYADHPGGETFDHSLFDGVLKRYVDSDGWVDYKGLKADSGELDRYIAAVAKAPFDELGRNEKLALLINAYNAFTLRLILDYYPIASIKDIPAEKRWDDVRWRVGPNTWSLSQIEHEQVRPKFSEPRVHFALVCAAVGCPPLRNEAYAASRIEQQLEDQAAYVHTHDRWLRFDPRKPSKVYLTSLYDWYGGDFEQAAGSVLDYASQHSPPLREAIDAGPKPGVQWLDYDWSLNSRRNRP